MKTHAYIPHDFSLKKSVRTLVFSVLLLVSLLAVPAGLAGVGTDTWSGAGIATSTTGWSAAANWAAGSANAAPGTGDSMFFTGSDALKMPVVSQTSKFKSNGIKKRSAYLGEPR